MTQVNHKLFGTGTVVSNDAKTVSVNFNGEVKNLAIKFANLTNEDGISWKPVKVKKVPTVTYATPAEYADDSFSDMGLLLAVRTSKGEWV